MTFHKVTMNVSPELEEGNPFADGTGACMERAELPEEFQSLEIQYDKAKERRLTMKIDLAIVPMASLLYLFCFIDRANIGNFSLKP